MITADKLRVGNRIQLSDGAGILIEHTVTGQNLAELESTDIGKRLFPIPITEKLLIERCGMASGSSGVLFEKEADDTTIMIGRKFLPSGGFIFQYKGVKIELEGLHHLQNIYFFIFGHELPLK